MSIFAPRDDGGIDVSIPPDVRQTLCDLGLEIQRGLDDKGASMHTQLVRPIAPGEDHDDPLMVMMRHESINTNADVLVHTCDAETITVDEAEAWFASLQVALSTLSSSLGLTSEERLDAAPDDVRDFIGLIQFVLAELLYTLEVIDPLGLD